MAIKTRFIATKTVQELEEEVNAFLETTEGIISNDNMQYRVSETEDIQKNKYSVMIVYCV